MTGLLAGLRIPISFTIGLLMTASLFSLLWLLTDKTFEVVETAPIKIEFSRVERDDPPQSRREPKVAKPPPVLVATDLPPLADEVPTEIANPFVRASDPLVRVDPRINVAGADREPVPLVRVNPTYPPRTAANGTEGWVRVQFDITATGAVTNVVAVESEPGTVFDAAAVDAVARWRYNPSILNGEAVERVGMQTLLRFTLEE